MTFIQGDYTNPLSRNDVRNKLVLSELSHVYYLARRIHRHLPPHILLEDLVNVGAIGLIEAADKYDPKKNTSLKAFASLRIRGAIVDSLRELDWGRRRLREKGQKLADSISKLSKQLGRQPAEDEIAKDVNLPIMQLHTLMGRLYGVTIAGQMERSPFCDSESRDLIESAPGDEKESPFERCLHSERSCFLTEAIETLSVKEQTVILLYYREELSMREVGAMMNLVESRISQIRSGAVRKLRLAIKNMQLQEDSFR